MFSLKHNILNNPAHLVMFFKKEVTIVRSFVREMTKSWCILPQLKLLSIKSLRKSMQDSPKITRPGVWWSTYEIIVSTIHMEVKFLSRYQISYRECPWEMWSFMGYNSPKCIDCLLLAYLRSVINGRYGWAFSNNDNSRVSDITNCLIMMKKATE